MADMNVRIVMTGHGKGKVYLNGEEFPNVRAVSMSAASDDTNKVTLEFIARTVEVEGVFDVSKLGQVCG